MKNELERELAARLLSGDADEKWAEGDVYKRIAEIERRYKRDAEFRMQVNKELKMSTEGDLALDAATSSARAAADSAKAAWWMVIATAILAAGTVVLVLFKSYELWFRGAP